jgi:hypothetical protein
MNRFDAAPWSVSLKLVSALGTVALAAAGGALAVAIPRETRAPLGEAFGFVVAIVPVAILAGALLFVVRGYESDGRMLRIHRLLWATTFALDGLERVWHDPDAMKRSIRLFGNGGLFSITGLFRNAALGRYRAFVTHPGHAVVLVTAAKVLVVSPATPEAFVEQARAQFVQVMTGPPDRARMAK